MNQNYLSIFKKYRKRKYERDLKSLQDDLEKRGLSAYNSGYGAKKTKDLEEDYKDEISMKEEKILLAEKNRKLSRTKNLASIIIPVLMLGLSLLIFLHGIKTEKKINRPYLEIDASEISEQLSTQHTDPYTAPEKMKNKQPYPFNDSFNFTIHNVGKLPAKYYINMNEFNQPNITEILPPYNATGVIFPNQKIKLEYNLKGISNVTSDDFINKMKCLEDNECKNSSKIIVKYDFQDSSILQFETVLEEKLTESNCDKIPTPMMQCSGLEWITKIIK